MRRSLQCEIGTLKGTQETMRSSLTSLLKEELNDHMETLKDELKANVDIDHLTICKEVAQHKDGVTEKTTQMNNKIDEQEIKKEIKNDEGARGDQDVPRGED